ncbi:hypothetical protein F9B74_06965 [Pelistega sp. NLN82]|uniref:Uncharacterized protein n=1 Tax=Pelistega ratti TaxID=2652177 RepID=A0A6L9Y6P9_9BURK|nr:hypothetical protein [Pelistega ratti]NEN76061.1 hypothetical protein [Pelistega ratti]
MKNFDCTILLSFEHNSTIKPNIKPNDKIKKLNFILIEDEKIKKIKKEYFNKEDNEYFIEFYNSEFISFITEDWIELNKPPKEVTIFIELIKEIISDNKLKNIKIYVCLFAQKGLTTDFLTKSSLDRLKDKLFFMSNHYFDIWTDNLIIEIKS